MSERSLMNRSLVAVLGLAATGGVLYYLMRRHRKLMRHARKPGVQEQPKKQLQRKFSSVIKVHKHEVPSESVNTIKIDNLRVDEFSIFEVTSLGDTFVSANIKNVIQNSKTTLGDDISYNKLIGKDDSVLSSIVLSGSKNIPSHSYVRAGPRAVTHFDPEQVRAAIVTCGGLCPGLNNVIREIVRTLFFSYGCKKVFGLRGGYAGFTEETVMLNPQVVEDIHNEGGTILSSSRGNFDLAAIMNFLERNEVNQLYIIGGDGTHRGAYRVAKECIKAGRNVSVAGIPKTIDNDVDLIDRSFGFNTAVAAAQDAIRCAKTEARCNLPNGVGIVKLMGRSAGYIAAHATLSSGQVDLCLVPEVPIVLHGPKGCLNHIKRRVKRNGHAVIVVAEGAGEELLGSSAETDASGNRKLPPIGEFMQAKIVQFFAENGESATVKYIDPSYMIRSCPANPDDSIYCLQLGQNAVHGAMAGYTAFTVGLCNNRMVYLPIPAVVASSPRSLDRHGRTWERVLMVTRQPNTVPDCPPE